MYNHQHVLRNDQELTLGEINGTENNQESPESLKMSNIEVENSSIPVVE